VLLLEAGEDANDDPRVATPGMFPLLFNTERDWAFVSEPSPSKNGRRIHHPRGRALGGSSCTNFMALVYPSKAGIDGWAELGNQGWDWDGMAPYYRKFQRHCPAPDEVTKELSIDHLQLEVQGTDGPIRSSYPKLDSLHPTEKIWMDMWKDLGKT
jgi:choline dehydrogenase-like flavoprotein